MTHHDDNYDMSKDCFIQDVRKQLGKELSSDVEAAIMRALKNPRWKLEDLKPETRCGFCH